MNLIGRIAAGSSSLVVQGTVIETRGTIIVRLEGVDGPLSCDVLHTSEKPLLLVEGDSVLVWRTSDSVDTGVILGRVGPSHADSGQPDQIPDEIVLDAKHSLTLRVGEGSITIRKDGRILIKGKDLVSHAQRMNRIKGGAVSIN